MACAIWEMARPNGACVVILVICVSKDEESLLIDSLSDTKTAAVVALGSRQPVALTYPHPCRESHASLRGITSLSLSPIHRRE